MTMREALGWAGFFLFFGTLACLFGCAAPSFGAAGCKRYPYPRWNVLVCDDYAVDRHCHKYVKNWDNGDPVDARVIRACHRKASWLRKGNIMIGESHLACLMHEIAHAEGMAQKQAMLEYPCLGEGRKGGVE